MKPSVLFGIGRSPCGAKACGQPLSRSSTDTRSPSPQPRHLRPGGYPAGMRCAVAASALLIATGSAALSAEGRAVPTRDCTTTFVAKWSADREAALSNPPKRPCWMLTNTGIYVCYREGCMRAHVYLNKQ